MEVDTQVKPQQEDQEMECEGGQQEEDEQSESSEDAAHHPEHSDSEGGESEIESHDNNINLRQRQGPISIKDIDKEFWKILHSYRPEINQLQLDHNHVRDSIKENCKIVADEASQQIKNLESKIELDLKEQMIYIKTLQSDIEICTKKFKRERTDFGLETQNLNKRIDEMEGHQAYVLSSIKTLAVLGKSKFIRARGN